MCAAMNNIFLIVSVFVLCYISFCSSVGERKQYKTQDCPLGSPKHILIGCNFCKCHEGNLINCSHYICSEDGFIINGNEQVCIEREMKYDKCTLCQCRNNTWYCMEPRCNTTLTRTKRSSFGTLVSFCLFEGTTKKVDECNECTCNNHKWVCSEEDCDEDYIDDDEPVGSISYVPFLEIDLKRIECEPGEQLAIDCAYCRCNPNGRGFECEKTGNCNEGVSFSLKANSLKHYFDLILQTEESNAHYST